MTTIKDANAGGETSSSTSLLGRLSVMMFLQYFVQGAYLPIAGVYVGKTLGFTPVEVGIFISALAVGPILAPFIVGQLVDRFIATERIMAICHLVGGVLMLVLAVQTGVLPVIIIGTVYSILYVPTMMLTNSLAFQHLKNSEMEFPWIRLFGTLGFIAPAYLIEFWWLSGLKGEELEQARAIAFTISGIAGIVMAVYCLSLPHTPPVRKLRDYAPGVIIKMLKKRDFLVLVIVSFLIAIVHQFVVAWFSPFMRDILDSGQWGAYEQSISSVGQICELGVLAVLGLLIKRLGFKRTMLLGATAYLLRCLLFALVYMLDPPFVGKLLLAGFGQTLHGFCFGCFMAVGYMYVDKVTPPDVRGSAQTLYGTFVLALGFFVGGFVSGMVVDMYTVACTDQRDWTMIWVNCSHVNIPWVLPCTDTDWTSIWLVCSGLCLVCVVGFALFFPGQENKALGDTKGA